MGKTVESYYEEALEFVEKLVEKVPLSSAVLDYWGGAVRIVYGSPAVGDCRSDCERCALFEAVGPDPTERPEFVTTLAPASPAALDTFPSRQKHLNCKTFDQYLGAFIAWLVSRCDTREKAEAELNLVAGFRILYMDGAPDLLTKEKESKRFIVEQALTKMGPSDERKEWLSEYARRLGLLGG